MFLEALGVFPLHFPLHDPYGHLCNSLGQKMLLCACITSHHWECGAEVSAQFLLPDGLIFTTLLACPSHRNMLQTYACFWDKDCAHHFFLHPTIISLVSGRAGECMSGFSLIFIEHLWSQWELIHNIYNIKHSSKYFVWIHLFHLYGATAILVLQIHNLRSREVICLQSHS